jgi:aminopeptidase N
VFNFSDNVLALGSWYPILAVYDETGWRLDPASPIGDSVFSDIAYYDVQITAPQQQRIAATGDTIAQQVEGDQTRWHFVSGPARDFFLILSPDFEVQTAQVAGITVRSYTLPGQEAGGRTALAVAQASLAAFEQQIGPYPYAEFEVVAAPMQHALGVEWPGIVLIAANLYAEPDDPTFAVTVAHEVAHQWWYNLVGNDVHAEPWLDEALATYSSSFYYEFGLGERPSGLRSFWQGRYRQLKAAGNDEAIAQPLTHFEQEPAGQYSAVVYTKGALFFDSLRQEIGDAAFFAALRSYAATYAYRIASGSDLLAEFEAAAGRPLAAFYDPWLYPQASGSS